MRRLPEAGVRRRRAALRGGVASGVPPGGRGMLTWRDSWRRRAVPAAALAKSAQAFGSSAGGIITPAFVVAPLREGQAAGTIGASCRFERDLRAAAREPCTMAAVSPGR